MELFEQNDVVKLCAPMVRYSKLPFRLLVRKYGCDAAYTPMILADSFVASAKARDSEFTTSESDQPLFVQFAANKVDDFVSASQLVSSSCQGVDLNCGCPQRWALHEGIGACLIEKPEFVSDLVRQTRNRNRDNLVVSVKIRIHKDVRKTVELCRQMEHAGVSFVSIHGRTREQRGEPVNLEAIREIKQSINVPVVANGDIKTLEDVQMVRHATGVDGVMAARGILENPAMFAGYSNTPKNCVQDWVKLAISTGTPFVSFHHHLIYMCERILSRSERKFFNTLSSTTAVLEYLEEHFDIKY